MVLVVVDAAIGAVNPLIFRVIIDEGILHKKIGLIEGLAFLVAGLALLDAALTLGERLVSARVGEGLIYDMRARVFAHVQSMPIAFFTRTQTGALVTRLNNDVLGAQQAFTDILSSVVSNFVSVILVLAAMLFLSWKITLVALILLPIFVVPARRIGRKLGTIVKESYALNAADEHDDDRTLQRRRCTPREALRASGDKSVTSSISAAGRVRDIGVTQAMYGRVFFTSLTLTAALATALVYGWGGVLAAHGTPPGRHGGGAHRLPEQALRPFDRSVEREHRRDDRTRFLPAGVRGTRPGTDDPRTPRARLPSSAARPRSSSTTSTSATPPPKKCPWLHWSPSRCSTTLRRVRCSTTCPSAQIRVSS